MCSLQGIAAEECVCLSYKDVVKTSLLTFSVYFFGSQPANPFFLACGEIHFHMVI